PTTTLLVAVVGADVLGTTLDEEHTHRPERIAALTGAALGDTLTPEIVATVLTHLEGGRKNLPPSSRFAVVVNKVTPENFEAARQTGRLLLARGVERVVLANVREEQPVVELMRA